LRVFFTIQKSDTTPASGALALAVLPTDAIQNGAPDAVLVYDTVTTEVIDALTYEGGGMYVVMLTGKTVTFDMAEGLGTSGASNN